MGDEQGAEAQIGLVGRSVPRLALIHSASLSPQPEKAHKEQTHAHTGDNIGVPWVYC